MKPARKREYTIPRARQYVSFFILALFLGLFVTAMTKPSSDTELVSLMFPHKVSFASHLDTVRNQLLLTFPGTKEHMLKTQYLQRPLAVSSGKTITAMATQTNEKGDGVLCIQLAHNNLNVRIMNAEPFGLMVYLTRKPTAQEREQLHKKAVFFTSASLYRT